MLCYYPNDIIISHRTSSELYFGLVDEAKRTAKQHDCLSRVFQTDLKDIRCKDIIGDMKGVYNQVNKSKHVFYRCLVQGYGHGSSG